MAQAHLSCSHQTVAESLREAETLCDQRGGRLTPLRKKVLSLLLESESPAKAYDLLEHLGDDGAAKPPSVYRSLDFLLDMGLAHKIESLNAYVACGHWKHGHAAVFLICDKCGDAGELHANDSVKKLTQEVESVDFRMRSAVIEIRGVCSACAA
jgi:Fur family zinc uptake transcriptional regulator